MSSVTLGAILDEVSGYEARLEPFYASIRDQSADNSVRMLTYFLSRRGRRQSTALARLSRNEQRHLRRIALPGSPSAAMDAPQTLLRMPPATVTGNQLIDAAMRQSAELIELYQRAIKQPAAEAAKPALDTLIRMEESDIVLLKKLKAMHYF